MIQFHSFRVEDTDKLNKHLAEFPLVKGAQVFTSNGVIVVPTDDGKAPNEAQRTVLDAVKRNELTAQKELVEHSLRVEEAKLAEAEAALATAEADLAEAKNAERSPEKNNAVQAIQGRIKYVKDVVAQAQNVVMNCRAEIRLCDLKVEALTPAA